MTLSGEGVRVGEHLVVPGSELTFETSRSSGPGGQNVNKVESRVTLRWAVRDSSALDDEQKQRILERLATRISRQGVLRVSAQRHRSQAANREATADRFAELLREALATDAERRLSRPPARARRQRLAGKRRRSEVKQRRGRVRGDD
ncbi:MAG TPA: alternative ribosome rescue aminoacyl-tRNA hydrolase ArfB [Thermoanaerobaculia bacterium]|nr:alternative ribosome rescue aminoacyl-tRNA hydrolase ArfB [Thermoanaerobaculia bacterium]